MRDEILTAEQSGRADRLAMEAGIGGHDLMEAAGKAVAESIFARLGQRHRHGHALILCGPGNNGGDGFVVARHLKAAGWTVDLQLLGKQSNLKGDAAAMAERWLKESGGTISSFDADRLGQPDVVVDSMFGAGFSRAVASSVAVAIERVNAMKTCRVAVDIPTGVSADSGQLMGASFAADLTITFFTRKPGHILLPGRIRCGEVIVVEIGTPPDVIDRINPRLWLNSPRRWLDLWPWPRLDAHKYGRGHGVVVSGPLGATGAAVLAARAALRIGSGLVTVLCPDNALAVLGAKFTSVMTAPFHDHSSFAAVLSDMRKNAVLLGPGNGVTDDTRNHVLESLAVGKRVVLDADALTVFAGQADALLAGRGGGDLVLTPHDGEFARLFPDLKHGQGGAYASKVERVREAARLAQAVVLLKGADTVVAAPDGRAVINANAPPELATAGAGDVLAGMILGLLAQGMPAFEAAAAAAWVHGEAAGDFGPGLIAEDLTEALPGVLRQLKQ